MSLHRLCKYTHSFKFAYYMDLEAYFHDFVVSAVSSVVFASEQRVRLVHEDLLSPHFHGAEFWTRFPSANSLAELVSDSHWSSSSKRKKWDVAVFSSYPLPNAVWSGHRSGQIIAMFLGRDTLFTLSAARTDCVCASHHPSAGMLSSHRAPFSSFWESCQQLMVAKNCWICITPLRSTLDNNYSKFFNGTQQWRVGGNRGGRSASVRGNLASILLWFLNI